MITRILLIICCCFVSSIAFSQSAYVKPKCSADNLSQADFERFENMKKINHVYAQVIATDASFKDKLDEVWTINCDLKTNTGLTESERVGLIARARDLKSEIATAVAGL